MKDDAIHYIAMNLARHRKTGKNWRSETIKAYPEAEEKINAMSNIELLELLGDLLGHPYK